MKRRDQGEVAPVPVQVWLQAENVRGSWLCGYVQHASVGMNQCKRGKA